MSDFDQIAQEYRKLREPMNIVALELKIIELKLAKVEIEKYCETITDALGDWKAMVANLDEENEQLQDENERLQADNEQLKSRLQESVKKIQELTSEKYNLLEILDPQTYGGAV